MGKKKKEDKRKDKKVKYSAEEDLSKSIKAKKTESDEKENKPEKKSGKSRKSGKKDSKAKSEKAKKAKTAKAEKAVPVQAETITPTEAAAIFRALGDESRMQILGLLENGELRITDLLQLMHLVQSTLSHHMKILTESGLVCCRKEGKSTYYSICTDTLGRAAVYLKKYRTGSPDKEAEARQKTDK